MPVFGLKPFKGNHMTDLEFIEVFKQKGGFDIIVGNPPWLKVTFEEKGIIAEKFPEIEIRSTTAPQIRLYQHIPNFEDP